MKRARTIYSGTLDASKAALFFDRMHALKDALEQLQNQYAEDIAEVVTELSDAQSIDPALIRMAFTQERQKRKREARIAKMDGGRATQLDLLADAAAGTAALVDWDDVRGIAPDITGDLSSEAFVRQQREKWDHETGEILPNVPMEQVVEAVRESGPAVPDVVAKLKEPEIPAFLRRAPAMQPAE